MALIRPLARRFAGADDMQNALSPAGMLGKTAEITKDYEILEA